MYPGVDRVIPVVPVPKHYKHISSIFLRYIYNHVLQKQFQLCNSHVGNIQNSAENTGQKVFSKVEHWKHCVEQKVVYIVKIKRN